ncbi:MAG: GTPase HflX [Candidatus Eisenbacteria bacterium]|nr:GTPase HflX [Candidatus Eisenbacteria bacterium]
MKDSFDIPEVASTRRRLHDLKAERARKEKAVLIGVVPRKSQEDALAELALLTETAGAEVVRIVRQRRDAIHPGTFVSKGKLDELKAMANSGEADLFIFDDDLQPNQVRRLQDELKKKILDRSELILDIFAARARTREAKLQVELAQLEYLLPRLTKMWSHLSRTGGGIGTRGPGETELETDRRLVRDKISMLKEKMRGVEKERQVQRNRRQKLHRTALVGYTNAGKSTLMNALTKANVLAEDKLFATLDATTRRLVWADGLVTLLSDTVGFVRKLPHHLVASFKSTFEEVVEADLLLHVVDASHPDAGPQIDAVERVLEEIGAGSRRTLLVLNKADRIVDEAALAGLALQYPGAIITSALRASDREALRHWIHEAVIDTMKRGPVDKRGPQPAGPKASA